MSLKFNLIATDGNARRGAVETAHGTFQTPAFMAVGTAATVKALTMEQVAATGTQVILGNTYHLMMRPGGDLVEQMGGGKVAGIGWACGVERLSMLLDADVSLPRPIAVIPVGDDVNNKAIEIAYLLRRVGFRVEHSYSGNLKKRMLKANKVNAVKAVIIGSDELANGEIVLKDLDSGAQKNVALDKIVEELR